MGVTIIADITELLQTIESGIYGSDIRMAIHDALQTINSGITIKKMSQEEYDALDEYDPDVLYVLYDESYDETAIAVIMLDSGGSTIPQTAAYYSSIDEVKTHLAENKGVKYKVRFGKSFNISKLDNEAFMSIENLGSIELSSNIKEIGTHCFDGCTNLKTATIKGTVQSIPINCFHNCASLEKVDAPSTFSKIEQHAFDGCEALKKFTIPNSLKTIAQSAFANSGLESMTIPSTVNEIYISAFSNCRNLTEFIFSKSTDSYSGVTTLSANILDGCTVLNKVILPSNLSIIEYEVFKGCTNLTSIEIPASITFINTSAFVDCGLKDIYIDKIKDDDIYGEPWGITGEVNVHWAEE